MVDTDLLQVRVEHALQATGVPEFKDVHVATREGIVIVYGVLPTISHWQLCLETCCHVEGVRRLIDEIAVLSESSATESVPRPYLNKALRV